MPEALECLRPGRIGGLTIRNRLIRAPTSESISGPDGEVTCEILDMYRALARGGVGLIMTGHLFIDRRGRHVTKQIGIHDDSCLPGLRELVDTVHAEGGRIFAEFGHAGSQSSVPDNVPLSPSAVPNVMTGRMPAAMTESDIEAAIEAFRQAARRAVTAGFDGIHIAGANGYLLSQFASPHTNRRDDRWGGDAQGRGRFMLEAFRAIRSAIGPDMPFSARIGLLDDLPNGMPIEEGLARVAALREARILDAVEPAQNVVPSYAKNVRPYVAVGPGRALADLLIHRVFPRTPVPDEAYFRHFARAIKAQTDMPVILMGGIRSTQTMDDILRTGDADFIAMARPFIREPDLVRKLEAGRRGYVDCVSCNACIRHTGKYSLRCWRTPKWRLAHYFSIVGRQALAKLVANG
jgi:2,4-dienoyl-CoA reductase-like NADH-dependent reductase (Old Yellow Enzyme family)